MVVIPWRRKFSARGRSAMVCWMCAWLSMKPGVTAWPEASMTRVASPGSRGSVETAAMYPSRTPTSATKPALPVPSMTVPPVMSTS